MSDGTQKGFHLISAGDMSADITSAVVKIDHQDNIGIQFIWTGVPVGVLGVSVSNNYSEASGTGTFTALTLSPSIAPSGSAADYFLALEGMPASYYKVTYTFTSDTGTLDVWVSGKGV